MAVKVIEEQSSMTEIPAWFIEKNVVYYKISYTFVWCALILQSKQDSAPQT